MIPPAPTDPLPAMSGRPARRPRLLVVDDQPVNIQALYKVFSGDYQVLMATGGEQALALCARESPDLVLLDMMMPGMDGNEVCRRLKADPTTCDIPVIFVTARTDESAEMQGLELGAVDFITKPINPRIVRARVRAHLALKAQSDLLRQWVYIDGLTGVYNRRYFDEQLANEWARSHRSRTALSLIMIDVDFFKRYNDRYGHQAGDACLRQVADALRECLRRQTDLLARYGGEEFVCMLPDTGFDGGMTVAEEFRQRVFARQIEHADSLVAPVATVSVGVATRGADATGGSPTALLQAADAQLYQAKSRGRHQICGTEIGSPPPPAGAAGAPPGAASVGSENARDARRGDERPTGPTSGPE